MTYENIHSYTNKKADIFTYEKPALLVVDMQKGFCYPGKQFYSSENIKLVPAISTLLEYFRGNNLPVYFTEFVYSKDCPNLNGRLWTMTKVVSAAAMWAIPAQKPLMS